MLNCVIYASISTITLGFHLFSEFLQILTL